MIQIPPSKQVVIEGHMCTDQYVDSNGRCTFDRSDIPHMAPPEALLTHRAKLVTPENHLNFGDLQRRKREQEGGDKEGADKGDKGTDKGAKDTDKEDKEDKEEDKETCPVCKYV